MINGATMKVEDYYPECNSDSYKTKANLAKIMSRETLNPRLRGPFASDLAAESMVQALKARNKHNSENSEEMTDSHFNNLLRQVVKGNASKIRKKHREQELPELFDAEYLDGVADSLANKEVLRILEATIYELPTRQSNVYRHLLDGRSCKQIAAELELNIQQVYRAIENGKKTLRHKLNEELFCDK